jgi:hypothetical protein
MSGQAGLRGYLVQTVICALEALDDDGWTQVTLEPNVASDKVDILWAYGDGRRKAVQVKSSENQIGMPQVEEWAGELAAWREADEYELILIGPCASTVTKAKRVTAGGKSVEVPAPRPLDVKLMLAAAAHLLSRRAGETGNRMGAGKAETVAGALTARLAEGATRGAELTREKLWKLIEEWMAEAPREIENRFVNVPPRNDFFTGREEILERLDGTLKAEGRAAIKQAISGLGGIGKTATATEYAHRYAADYSHVLWTGAESAAALTEGFADIADKLSLAKGQKSEERVEAVKRWLAENPGWLLILDNADAPEVVKPFLPSPLTGAVLLTSRATNFDVLGKCRPVMLEVMTEEEALAFLKGRTEREELSESEEVAAKALAEELGYLPLALEQAAAYIKKNQVSFAKYLEIYRTRRLEILKKSPPLAGDYRLTVETTWTLNFEQVEAASPAAADVLRMSAYCAPEAIPFAVVEKGGAEISAALAEALAEAAVVNEVLSPLTEYSLIGLDGEREEYSVHRLVQAVVRDGMTESERREWIERGVKAVNAAFPDVTDFYQWGVCARLAPHGVALGAAAGGGVESAEVVLLLIRTGYFLKEQGRYADTEPLFERSLAILEKALGAEHPSTAVSLNNLAELYRAQGEYGRATPLSERALAIYEKTYGAEHSSTAASLDNLAALYSSQNEYGKALPLSERALAINEKACGAEHPWTATNLNNLAYLYKAQGEYGKALPLYERSLAIYEKTYGAEHPDTALSLNNLAGLYKAQGEYGRALPLLERALAIREKALGAEHPFTAESLNNLAALYDDQGEYGRALPLSERSLAIREKALGAEHPDTAQSLNNLAGLYKEQGEYGRALPLYERSLAIREKALGAEHPSTAVSLNNLAWLYDAQGDATRAEELHARALAVRIKILGSGHPDTAMSRWGLAATLWTQGRLAEARELHEAALEGLRGALGEEHPHTKMCAAQLAQLPPE